MAWRIDEAVVRGEIDNRERDRVRGQIWFVDRDEPVVLELAGNAWRDLAGKRLVFSNPQPKAMDLAGLAPIQDGVVGDITASRKVKVPDIPMDQIGEYYAAKKPWPWHWGNSLYLEWFSARNGRVVIESASFQLTLEGDSTWDMSEEEETAQQQANGEAMIAFMQRLSEAFAPDGDGDADEDDFDADDDMDMDMDDDDDDDDRDPETPGSTTPMTEEEAERWQARQDLLLDRVQARLHREGVDADYSRILDEERERLRRELGEPEPDEAWKPEPPDWDAIIGAGEEAAEAAEAAAHNPEIDPWPDEDHPLVERATNLFHWLSEQADEDNWLPEHAQEEHPVNALLNATMCVGPKLAGALNGGLWPPSLDMCALTIVRLKRAHGYVDDALHATESCQEDKLIEPRYLGPAVIELIDIAHDIKALIAKLRERLGERQEFDADEE